MNAYVREPVNAFTHLGGAILSFIALLAMLVKVSIKMPSFLCDYSCYFVWYWNDGYFIRRQLYIIVLWPMNVLYTSLGS